MENLSLKNIKVKESPVDTLLEGVVLSIQKTTYNEILDNAKKEKFKQNSNYVEGSLDEPRLLIKFETEFKGTNFRGEHNMPFYDEPSSSSDMGKLIAKYGNDLDVGSKIKIDYNDKGIGRIRF